MISKFKVKDKVRIMERCPMCIDLPRGRPRTIIKIHYDAVKQCNFYLLGSNARGKMAGDGDPRWGFRSYWFRSYQLEPYVPRDYHFKRPYKKCLETPQNRNLAEQGGVV